MGWLHASSLVTKHLVPLAYTPTLYIGEECSAAKDTLDDEEELDELFVLGIHGEAGAKYPDRPDLST